jgi:hypothetical protein
MSMRVGVSGQEGLFGLADTLRQAGNRKLGQKLDRGIRNAAKEIEKEVRRSSDTYMPRGFEQTFKGSLEAKHQVRLARERSITIVFFARGQRLERRLADMEKGRLRHPVRGRTRRLRNGGTMKNPWVTQRIKAGVISEPSKRAAPKAAKQISDVISELVAEINQGT